MKRDIQVGDKTHSISLITKPDGQYISLNGENQEQVDLQHLSGDLYRVTIGDDSTTAKIVTKGEDVFIEVFDQVFNLTVLNPVEQAHSSAGAGDLSAKAVMPGVIVEINVKKGDWVEPEQPILTMESMKLFTIISATGKGKVTAINYQEGDTFTKGAILVEIVNVEETDK